MSSPLVSVVMSVFNGADTLSKSIESILEQSYGKLEFVIIDDGSTDGSSEIIRRYAERDKRIKYFSQVNHGLTYSLNRGIELCSGKYIARQDADDVSERNRLEVQLNAMQSNKVDLVVSLASVNSKKEVPKGLVRFLLSDGAIECGNIFIHGTFFGEKNTFLETPYNESFKFAQDFKFILDLLEKGGRVGMVEQNLYRLHQDGNNISFTKKKEQDEFAIMALRDFLGRDPWEFRVISNQSSFIIRNILRILFLSLKKVKNLHHHQKLVKL